MGTVTVWQELIFGFLTLCATLVANAYLFGRRVGSMLEETKTLKKENDFLKSECARLRSAIEAYTGVSLEGVRFRQRRGDD
jgi:hypothetical protein